ncbi:MAG: pirin family protein [Bacteroidetes bacterium]|nr:pirin family protein [Bacteroidota bacterium]
MKPQPIVKALHRAVEAPMADLVTFRALPTGSLPELNPFLFLNHHGPQVYPPNNSGLPFGPHPHKGFETLTFVFDGEVAHSDSTGQTFVTGPGGVQWMTAGRGIEHAEISPNSFLESGGPLEIIQVWMNLPAALKRCEPWYRGFESDALLHIQGANGAWSWHVVSGEVGGLQGPVDSMTGLFMSWVDIHAEATFVTHVPANRGVMLYVVRGEVEVNGVPVKARTMVELATSELGTPEMAHEEWQLEVTAWDEDALVLFCHGDVIDEPVVAYGPFVMNTEDEIREAYREYQSGKFGRVGG